MRALREEKRRQFKKLDIVGSRTFRHRISTMDWRNQRSTTSHLYSYDRYSGSSHYYLTYKEFAHRITIIFFSAGAFGIGIGQLLAEVVGK